MHGVCDQCSFGLTFIQFQPLIHALSPHHVAVIPVAVIPFAVVPWAGVPWALVPCHAFEVVSYLFGAIFWRVGLVAVIRILVWACWVVVPGSYKGVGGRQVLHCLVFLWGRRWLRLELNGWQRRIRPIVSSQVWAPRGVVERQVNPRAIVDAFIHEVEL